MCYNLRFESEELAAIAAGMGGADAAADEETPLRARATA
jgi:hypothetical protein